MLWFYHYSIVLRDIFMVIVCLRSHNIVLLCCSVFSQRRRGRKGWERKGGREEDRKAESRIRQRRGGTKEGQAEEEETLGETKERRACAFKSGINGRASVWEKWQIILENFWSLYCWASSLVVSSNSSTGRKKIAAIFKVEENSRGHLLYISGKYFSLCGKFHEANVLLSSGIMFSSV